MFISDDISIMSIICIAFIANIYYFIHYKNVALYFCSWEKYSISHVNTQTNVDIFRWHTHTHTAHWTIMQIFWIRNWTSEILHVIANEQFDKRESISNKPSGLFRYTRQNSMLLNDFLAIVYVLIVFKCCYSTLTLTQIICLCRVITDWKALINVFTLWIIVNSDVLYTNSTRIESI